MRILGISDHAVSGAAVVDGGIVVAAVNEERLARKKMVIGFPWKSIESVLTIAGIGAADLDEVAIASEWGHFLGEYVDFGKGIFGVDEGIVKNLFFSVGSELSFLRSKAPVIEKLYYGLKKPAFARRRRKIREVLRERFGITCPVVFVSHHLSHAAGAYNASGFEDGLMVTLDGAGDGYSSHVYDVRNGNWRHLHSVPAFDSLGNYYAYATQICGFTAGKHEGKITGLAAYGQPSYRDVLDRFIRYENGTMTNIGDTYRHAALRKLQQALPEDFSKKDLSASIQDLSEEITTRYIAHWRERTGHTNVGLAGGLFGNVKINQRVHEINGVKSVFVYPAMSDEGIAAGAALARWTESNPSVPRPKKCFDHVFLGPEFSESEIRDALQAEDVAFTRPANFEADVARMISEGCVVARFAGRMEYGPRALGNRSILYRPDEPEVNNWLNQRLKRTEFMPFAPAVLAEDRHLYFKHLEGAEDTARFMTITFDCTELMKRTCPGVVHVDGTARPQLVSESDNPAYYRIIQEFKKITGLSCIVNTSFNIHEEPIVCTPEDAIRAFKVGHLDALAIGPFLAENANSDRQRRRAEKRANMEIGAQ